ncbi:hypothetical protein WJX79_004315 [Trebouxia sp. C0005]
MATEVHCATRVWQPRHSRHSSFPRLPYALGHGSFLHGMPPQLRNDRQAFGSSRLCCCKQTIQPSSAGSNKKVHWICTKCPKGQPHLFAASPNSRICHNSEYDTAKNGVGPEQLNALSGYVLEA